MSCVSQLPPRSPAEPQHSVHFCVEDDPVAKRCRFIGSPNAPVVVTSEAVSRNAKRFENVEMIISSYAGTLHWQEPFEQTQGLAAREFTSNDVTSTTSGIVPCVTVSARDTMFGVWYDLVPSRQSNS